MIKIWVTGHSRSLEVVPFKSLGTVSYSHSVATMFVSLAVSTQYTNVTDKGKCKSERIYIALLLYRVARIKIHPR